MIARLIVLAVAAGLAAPAASVAAPAASSCSSVSDLGWSARGLAKYMPLSSPWWSGYRHVPALPAPSSCGGAAGDAVAVAVSAQGRFARLYLSFPSAPTSRQWSQRYVALIRQAIATDDATLRAAGVWAQARADSFNLSMNCGVSPNPPGACDNGTLPSSASYEMRMISGVVPSAVAADRLALTGLLSRPYAGGAT